MILHDQQFLSVTTGQLAGAQKTVCLSTFKAQWTTSPRGRRLAVLFETLAQAKKEGVTVKCLINYNEKKSTLARVNLPTVKKLLSLGIEARFLPRGRTCHAKLIIIDSQKVILGSHNLSLNAMRSNFETSLLLTEKTIVKPLETLFYKLWNKAKQFSF